MGTSLYADYLKSQQSPSPGSLYSQYLATQTQPTGPAGHDFHAEYRSGALAKRMAAANKRDAENAAEQDSDHPFLESLAATGANLAQGIPGMEAAEAYTGHLASKLPGMGGERSYAQSLADLRSETGKIPTALRIGEQMAGAAPLAAILPGNPVVSGALLGGTGQAFAADPDESLGRRAYNTAIGTGVGALLGRYTDVATTGAKAALASNPQSNILARQAARAASAAKLYGAAQTEGEMNGANTAVRQFIQEPEIAQRIEALQSLEQYKNTPADSPQMMRALARSMSDEANSIEKGLSVTDPSKPNTLRDKAKSLSQLKQRLTDVVSDPVVTTTQVPVETAQAPNPSLRQGIGNFWDRIAEAARRNPGDETVAQAAARTALERHGAENVVSPALRGEPGTIEQTTVQPAMMPTFREASQDFAKRSGEIDALRKGMFALQGESGLQRPTPNNVVAKNPKTLEAFANWAKTGGVNGGPVAPGELQAAREGVLGDLSNAWRYEKQGIRMAPFRHDAGVAAKLLRAAPTQGQSLTDLLQVLGLTSLNSPFANR